MKVKRKRIQPVIKFLYTKKPIDVEINITASTKELSTQIAQEVFRAVIKWNRRLERISGSKVGYSINGRVKP